MAVYTIQSAAFSNVFLRMDGRGVVQTTASGGGVVNCQYGASDWERFNLVDQGGGLVAIGSVAFSNVFLRMDGNGVTQPAAAGAGVVNCQYGADAWERFRVLQQGDGTVTVASAHFSNVFLRTDGRGVTQSVGSGAGVVNCQYGASTWERFRLSFG
ncbi:fascin domain-containing protein [Nannocystis punicea]|uniref:Ricin B lectin domain-containing protein n=1 Tax=Nannocystis punicea TaxID=2995304 RepID=A0ABY7GSC3_9BACT|nr:hypothetical protein [Nannocystis poenicansa]WAS89856.1 hypothetical protein O0S08_26995 [Nannocystis poenicansa]